jgi:hypothetical protein
MLREALGRVDLMLRGYEAAKTKDPIPTPPEPRFIEGPDGSLLYNEPAYTTASDVFSARVESYVRPPEMMVEIPQPSLSEYRAYFEWALTLARKVSDVVSETERRYPTDVLVGDLVNDPTYHLPGLPETIIRRIDQAVAHQTYWIRDGGWGMAEIGQWHMATLPKLVEDLRAKKPKVATEFEEWLDEYEDQVVEYG